MIYVFSFFQGITVREGDSNLITRCESKTLGKMEIIREFSKEGMILVRILDLVSPYENPFIIKTDHYIFASIFFSTFQLS